MVLDASAAVELLLNSIRGKRLTERLRAAQEIHAPHVIDLEIVHTLRRLVLHEALEAGRAALALDSWRRLDVERHRHDHLLERIWSWRGNLTACDAAYVVLAEIRQVPLVTTDRRLAAAAGISVPVEIL